MGQLVAHGDTTSTRGVVIAVASGMFEEGRRLALHGEEATCGNCKGSFKIVGTVTHMSDNGRMLVQHGDWVMCPCGKNRVLANSKMHYHDEGSASRTEVPSRSGFESPNVGPGAAARDSVAQSHMFKSFDDHYVLVERESGATLANTEYAIVRASGAIEHGVSDAHGKTHLLSSTTQVEDIDIYV